MIQNEEPLLPTTAEEHHPKAKQGTHMIPSKDIQHTERLDTFHGIMLLSFRLREFRKISNVNFVISIITLWYISVNICMLILNAMDHNDDDCDDQDSIYVARCGSPASTYVFHNLEFWATFIFAVVQSFAIVYTPKKSKSTVTVPPLVLKLVLFFDIVSTFLSALMVALDLETFETVSHQIEYTNELTMSFVDLVLLSALLRKDSNQAAFSSTTAAVIALLVAVIQISIYNGMGETDDGDKVGEKPAHYCEFIFEILSAGVTFWYCMNNKATCDRDIEQILYSQEHGCTMSIGETVLGSDRETSPHQILHGAAIPVKPSERGSSVQGGSK